MLYIPRNVEQKTSAKGTNYIVADFEDTNGQVTEKVSTFDPVIEGKSVEGAITQNGQYMNFKITKQFQTGGKTGQIERVMERKNESISHFQDAKEKSIQLAGSIRCATDYVTALFNNAIFDSREEKDQAMKIKLREMIIYYKNLYENPQDINPSSSDQPF